MILGSGDFTAHESQLSSWGGKTQRLKQRRGKKAGAVKWGMVLTFDQSPTVKCGGQSVLAQDLWEDALGPWHNSSERFRKLPSVNSCRQVTLRFWVPPPHVLEHCKDGRRGVNAEFSRSQAWRVRHGVPRLPYLLPFFNVPARRAIKLIAGL